MKLVLHAGLHRAASSSLQRLLNEERSRLAKAGILAVPQARLKHPGMEAFKRFARAPADSTPQRIALAEGLRVELERQAAHGFRAAILSDENMLGPMPGKEGPPFGRREAFFAGLEVLAHRFDVTLILLLREHASWLHSLYKFRALRGDRRSFRAFADAIDSDRLSFAPLLDEAQAIDGVTLAVESFEALAKDGGLGLLGRLSDLLGDPELARSALPKVNTSPPSFFYDVIAELEARSLCFAPESRQSVMDLAATVQGEGEVLGRLAQALSDNTVRLPLPIKGKKRLKLAQAIRRHDRFGLLKGPSPAKAAALLKQALDRSKADASLDPSTAATLADLRRRFASDREAIAARWLPDWRELRY